MKKTAILVLILVITAAAEKTLWKDEMNCLPMIPGGEKGDYSKIMILDKCSDPVKAFDQWLRDNYPQWTRTGNFGLVYENGWAVFHYHD